MNDKSHYAFVLETFGLQALKPFAFQFNSEAPSVNDRPYPDLNDTNTYYNNPLGVLGAYVFDNVEMSQTINGVPTSIGLNSVLISVSQSKNIVKTALEGRDGTVKEYISMGDYEVSLSGVVGNPLNDRSYPTDSVNKLYQLCTLPVALSIKSGFLQRFNIQTVVVESFELSQREGFPGIQPFSVKLVSDTDPEIRLLKNQ